MEVNVLMTRKVAQEMHSELNHYLLELRRAAKKQKGYLGGSTFINIEDNNDVLVISTWASKEDWYNWYHNNHRREIMACVDAMLIEPTKYKVYRSF